MKKFICSLLLVLVMLLTLTVVASAETITVALSEDLQTLNYGGHNYSRVDASNLRRGDYMLIENIIIPERLQEMIRSVDISTNVEYTIMDLTAHFHDGSTLYISYLRDDLREEYDELIGNDNTPCFVELYLDSPEGVSTTVAALKGQSTTYDLVEYDYYGILNYFEVVVYGSNCFDAVRGAVLSTDEGYYYMDYAENGIYGQHFSDISGEVKVWRITDDALITQLDKEFNGTSGLFDFTLANLLKWVVLIFLFILVPTAIGIIFIILATKDRGHGRKVAITTAILSGCVVLTAILAFISF